MKFSIIILLVFLAIACGQQKFHNSLGSRIINGKLAPVGAFPYQASVRLRTTHRCGGAIIHDRWILLAAHCLQVKHIEDLTVQVGSNKLNIGGKVYFVIRGIYHPEYQAIPMNNDIALIKVHASIEFNEFVKPISLPKFDLVKSYERAVVSGWGKLSSNGGRPVDLQYLELYLLTTKTCSNVVPIYLYDSQICAFSKYNQGVCHGDSGSPLVVNGTLVGVTSRIIKNCAAGFPDVFTQVYKYVNWINSTINSQ